MVNNKILTIWFDDQGNLLSHANKWLRQRYNAKSEEGNDFNDTMVYVAMWDGGSNASRVKLKSDNTGREYTMFLDSFNEVILAKRFINNSIDGTFRYSKRGQAQAIELVLPKKP